VPFTPFHMGPGLLVKALLQGRTCQKFCVQGSFQERDPVKRSPYRMAN